MKKLFCFFLINCFIEDQLVVQILKEKKILF